MKTIIQPHKIAKPRGNYSHGILVQPGELLFIAGQTAIGPDGTIVGVGDPYAQARQVFENIAAILLEADSDFNDIVKITTYITDIAYRTQVNEARREFFQKDFPASTLVVVKGLADAEFLVEIEAIACIQR